MMRSNFYDVIIVGGAVMGSSVAYHLLISNPKLRLAVVERDPTYSQASSSLSLGGVRVQFSLKENIQISLYALDCFAHFEEEMAVNGEKPFINFREEGYLFLIDSSGRALAEESLTVQKKLGGEVEWWSSEKIKREFSILSVNGLVGGTFGRKDGYLDPYAVMMAYRAKAVSLGAQYITDEVIELSKSGRQITGVQLASGLVLNAGIVVNAAGPWAAEIARTAGVELPVVPIKRQVFALKPAITLVRPLPLIIAPSGLYFRSETGGLILVGRSMDEDKVGFDFTWEKERFTEILWPELARIVPAFDTLKLVRGWAGLYAQNQLDSNAILGPWPELKGLYLINGFSGHGLQQSPASGRYLAELILGRTPFLDLGSFSPQRILDNRPLSERGVV
ncbi:MAG: FAD-binding oxidoreductase [Deltaproteobacteria bacterium]|nr:FAD-binding oxidoreductase [Deltaproteobacteria bacterium]